MSRGKVNWGGGRAGREWSGKNWIHVEVKTSAPLLGFSAEASPIPWLPHLEQQKLSTFFCCYFQLQVYVLNPLENLRGYINNRPPLVIFMISVSAVAIAFLTIGYFFKIKEIKSPELTEVSGAHHHCLWPGRSRQTNVNIRNVCLAKTADGHRLRWFYCA